MRYDAFISYSHAADGKLAPALQSALHRLAKPWYRRRALRIFRDQTSLAATPELWPAIETALGASEHFLLLASPTAADSTWVRREVHWWLDHRSPQQLLLVWTGGELVWDQAAGDFDWTHTDALPDILAGNFPSEPLWVDLRWARSAEQLSLKDHRFLRAVGDLAAPLHGRPKEDLLGEDVRQHQRALRLAGTAIAALIVLMVAAVVAAVVAIGQRDVAERNANLAATETARAEAETLRAESEADRADTEAQVAQAAEQTAEARRGEAEEARQEAENQARIALSRQLTAQAISDRTGTLDLRLLLAVEATKLDPDGVDAQDNLLTLVDANPALDRFLHGAEVSEVADLAFSPDGALLAGARIDGSTVLWDVAAAVPIGEPLGTGQGGVPFPVVAFSPKRWALATAGSGGIIELWDVATRDPLGTPLVVPAGVCSDPRELTQESVEIRLRCDRSHLDDLAFAPDGRTIYSAGVNLLGWDLTGDAPRAERFGDDFTTAVAMSPNGRLLASDGPWAPASIILWDVTTREPIGKPLVLDETGLAAPPVSGAASGVTGVTFSPDGKFLAASDATGWIVVWDAVTQQRLHEVPPSSTGSGISDLAFSPDSSAVVSTGDNGQIIGWNVIANPMSGLIMGHHDGVRSVAYSPDGRWLATGSRDGTVALWDPARWSALGQTLVSDDIFLGEVAISPDGQLVAAGSTSGNIVLWDAATGRPAGELPWEPNEFIDAVAFSPDGRFIAAGNMWGNLALWDAVTHQRVATRDRAHARPIRVVTFSPDNRLLASGAADGVVGLWDISAGQIIGESLVGDGDVGALAFSSDGQILAAGFEDGADGAVLWDVARRDIVARLSHSTVYDLAFSPDGQQLLTSNEDGIDFWDTARFQPVGEPLTPAGGSVTSLALSSDGRILAAGGGDGTIQLWDVASRQPIGPPLPGHEDSVVALAFDPQGALLASRGNGDHSAPVLWRVGLPAWQEIACRIAGRNLSRAAWAQFLGGEEYRKTCPDLPAHDEQATPTPAEAPDRPLDLSTMVVSFGSVADLRRRGVVDSYSRTLSEQSKVVADARGEDVATVRSVLEAAGWRRQQGIVFTSSNLREEYIVTEYETAEGAAAGFDYIEGAGVGGSTPVPLNIPFGEQAIARHENGIDSSGAPYEYERLVFRFDNLVAEVGIWGYDSAGELLPGLAEGLGAELRERMARERTNVGPGLSNRVLRLVGDEVADNTDRDRYLRIGGQDLLTYWEAVDGLAPTSGPADNVRQPEDTYRVWTAIGDGPGPIYTVYLFAYPSSEIASGVFAAAREDLNVWATPVAEDPLRSFERTQISNTVFGEESVTVSQRAWIGEPGEEDSYVQHGYVTWARVGAEIVVMFVETPAQPPPLAVANELMTAQVTCLRATEICEPAPVPAAFSSVAAATPETASSTPQVIAGVVSLDPD